MRMLLTALLCGIVACTQPAMPETAATNTAEDTPLYLADLGVDHGITTYAPTSVYGFFKAHVDNVGGLNITGISEADRGLVLRGVATNDDTADDYTTATGTVAITAQRKNGTGAGVPSANANMLAIKDGNGARFLFKGDGALVMPGASSDDRVGNGRWIIGHSDGEALSLRASGVSHGVTSVTDTRTYGVLRPLSNTTGGLRVFGLSEDIIGVRFIGISTSADATKSTSGSAPVELTAQIKSGASTGAFSGDDNLAVIRNNADARYIFGNSALFIADGSCSASPTGGILLCAEGGVLKYKDPNGNLTTLGPS